jgi:CTP:molybdopterin cytidylyltransferase MocA
VEGLLLAAGAGRRMGTPKALVTDERGSWLVRGVTTLADGGCRRVTVVLGAEAGRAMALLEDLAEPPRVVVADDWSAGMGASLRAGMLAFTDSTDGFVLVSLVDLPDLVPEVVARVGRAQRSPHALARAAYGGVPGHPVLFGRDHWPGVLETAHGDQGARAYLAGHDVELVECGDLATGRDRDFPGPPRSRPGGGTAPQPSPRDPPVA